MRAKSFRCIAMADSCSDSDDVERVLRGPYALPGGRGYLTPQNRKTIKQEFDCTAQTRRRDGWDERMLTVRGHQEEVDAAVIATWKMIEDNNKDVPHRQHHGQQPPRGPPQARAQRQEVKRELLPQLPAPPPPPPMQPPGFPPPFSPVAMQFPHEPMMNFWMRSNMPTWQTTCVTCCTVFGTLYCPGCGSHYSISTAHIDSNIACAAAASSADEQPEQDSQVKKDEDEEVAQRLFDLADKIATKKMQQSSADKRKAVGDASIDHKKSKVVDDEEPPPAPPIVSTMTKSSVPSQPRHPPPKAKLVIRLMTMGCFGLDKDDPDLAQHVWNEYKKSHEETYGPLTFLSNCIPFYEPGKKATKHTGRHAFTIQAFVFHPCFEDWLRKQKAFINRLFGKNRRSSVAAIAQFCEHGKHRSVAGDTVLRFILEEEGSSCLAVIGSIHTFMQHHIQTFKHSNFHRSPHTYTYCFTYANTKSCTYTHTFIYS